MWRTDGTDAGTFKLSDYSGSTFVYDSFGARMYYVISAPANNVQTKTLWSSDGTIQGTEAIGEFDPQVADSSRFGDLGMSVDGKLIFINSDNTGKALRAYATDGTAAGTHEILSIDAASSVYASTLKSLGDVGFLFVSKDGVSQLWQTDGTSQGTHQYSLPAGSTITLAPSVVDGKLALGVDNQTVLIDPDTLATLVGPSTATMELVDGVLRVFGTKNADNIRVYNDATNTDRFVVNLNGVRKSFPFHAVSRLYIYGYSGDDTVAVVEKYGKFTVRSRIWGGAGSDVIMSGGARDTLFGDAGDDSLNGGNNDDQLAGDVGDDSIVSGNGNDTASGDAGADTVYGNKGDDYIGGGDDSSGDQLDGGNGADVIFGKAVVEIFFNGQQSDTGDPLDEILLA